MLFEGTAPESIRKLLDDNPVSIDGEFELNGVRYPIVRSQPVPHDFRWDDPPSLVELYTVRLIDLGHGNTILFLIVGPLGLRGDLAQWEDREPTTRMISAYGLRAPEVILEADFDSKVDIWSLGCMVSFYRARYQQCC